LVNVLYAIKFVLLLFKLLAMDAQQLQLLLDLAKKLKSETREKAEILNSLKNAKILTEKGNFTRHYPHLRKIVLTKA